MPIQLPTIPDECTKLKLGIDRPAVENANCRVEWVFYNDNRYLGMTTVDDVALNDIEPPIEQITAQGFKQTSYNVMQEWLYYTYERPPK